MDANIIVYVKVPEALQGPVLLGLALFISGAIARRYGAADGGVAGVAGLQGDGLAGGGEAILVVEVVREFFKYHTHGYNTHKYDKDAEVTLAEGLLRGFDESLALEKLRERTGCIKDCSVVGIRLFSKRPLSKGTLAKVGADSEARSITLDDLYAER